MHSSRPKWLLWGSIFVLCIVLACLAYAAYLYNQLNDSRTEGFEETSQQILEQTSITEVQKIEQYSGSSAYHVVFGKNAEGDEKLIFYPLKGKEKSLTTIDRSDMISEEEIFDQWKSDCQECELMKITPALENNEPLWEITYKENNNKYVMQYLSIYDGSAKEQYRFSRMFN